MILCVFWSERSWRKRARMLPNLPSHQYQDRERFVGTARIDLSYSALPFAFWPLRLSPYGGLSVMSRSIGQPLADCALNRPCGALNVIYAQRNAIGIAEIVFAQIAMQVLFGAVLIDALHAAFEDRIEAFDRVGGDEAFALVARV